MLLPLVAYALAAALSSGPPPYWRDPRIHNLGNVGLGGWVHALFAPIATSAIDTLAYKGVDIRAKLLSNIPDDSVVDLCCGTGTSTTANGIGIDTSGEMLTMAGIRYRHKHFEYGNAETWGETDGAAVATVMFALHEMPREGRRAVLRNALRVASRHVLVVDIAPHYEPSVSMLTGEPYILEYLENIQQDITEAAVETDGWIATYRCEAETVGIWEMWHLSAVE